MSVVESESRLRALRRRLRWEALYVSAPPNIRYLTGFSGSAGHLLVTRDEATLITDGRYRTQARQQTSGIAVEISVGDSRIALAEAVGARGLKELGFEANRLSYDAYAFLRREAAGCSLVPADSPVEALRILKSEDEVRAIRRSVDLNSNVFDEVCRRLEPGWTESRLAAELEFGMRRLGAEGPAFPTIVAGGPHGALPHAEPRDAAIPRNTLVVVDQGAVVGGYCSDMTRMIAVGRPDSAQMELVEAVREAQAAAVGAIRAGVECRTVDGRARQALRKRTVGGVRLDTAFTHSTGHGVGLEIHESPRIAARRRQRLRAGMVVTVEPGAYLEGLAGVRIEDVVVVTEDGCEILTRTPRELRIL